MSYLFVYGTLQRNGPLHHALQNHSTQFIHKTATSFICLLQTVNFYPMMFPIFECTDFPDIDEKYKGFVKG